MIMILFHGGGDRLNVITKNTEDLLDVSKETDLDLNFEKTKGTCGGVGHMDFFSMLVVLSHWVKQL
jgi:hypothetical protein